MDSQLFYPCLGLYGNRDLILVWYKRSTISVSHWLWKYSSPFSRVLVTYVFKVCSVAAAETEVHDEIRSVLDDVPCLPTFVVNLVANQLWGSRARPTPGWTETAQSAESFQYQPYSTTLGTAVRVVRGWDENNWALSHAWFVRYSTIQRLMSANSL